MRKIEYSEKKIIIDDIVVERYNNGDFFVGFQEPFKSLAKEGLTKTESNILFYLLGAMNNNAKAFLNYKYLAENMNCSERSVKEAVKKLEKRNLLVCRHHSDRPRVDECELIFINHRLAFKGSLKTNHFAPDSMPRLLNLQGKDILPYRRNEDLMLSGPQMFEGGPDDG